MVTILMISAKMATLGLLKIRIFWNKGYDIIISWRHPQIFITWFKFYYRCGHVTKVWQLYHFYEKSYHNLDFIRIWLEKPFFFEGWSWFKFNNFGLALDTNLEFYTSVAKVLKLKVKNIWRPNPTFVEVTGEKLVGERGLSPHPE